MTEKETETLKDVFNEIEYQKNKTLSQRERNGIKKDFSPYFSQFW